MTPDYREDRIGTYQTTFRVETWVRGRKTPRVQYRTTFGGKIEDHNSILELVRKLHAEKDGKASALIEVFEKAERWEKYTLDGKNITPEIIEQIEELEQKLEAVKTARDKLYEDLPAGDVDAFTLLKIIQAHIAELDRIRETS